jgi:hypothetical protein
MNSVPVAGDSFLPLSADAPTPEISPFPVAPGGASTAGPPLAADHSDATRLTLRFANLEVPKASDTQGPIPDDAAERRLIAAFVEHARAELGLPDADSKSIITAFFASRAETGADTTGRWLENDTRLMLRLAKARGLFAGEPGAADLDPGHRRLLANALALALTQPIDWRTALNADAAGSSAVFYDGITLRNAAHLSIKDAAAAMDVRIGQALGNSAAPQGFTALIPQLRVALIVDPTLSFEPLSQTARYGSRDWVKLWTGIQTCMAAGMDAATLSAAEVMAFGEAIGMAAALQDQTPALEQEPERGPVETKPRSSARRDPAATHTPARPASPLLPQTGLLLMAHAAGKVDLAQLREDNQAEITQKIQAYAAEEFKAEIELAETIDRVLALREPPTARGIAEEALKAKGLDPMAIVIEEPVSSKGKRLGYKLHDFYVKFDDLSEIESNQFNGDLIEKAGKNNPRYKDVYNRRFDTYISDYIEAHKKILRLVVDMAGRDGFREADNSSSVTVERIQITSHRDVQAQGFFVSCADGDGVHRYFFSPCGIIEKIPSRMDWRQWLIQNRHAALTEEDLKKIQSTSGSDTNFSCSLVSELSGTASSIDAVVDAHFRPKLLELKKQSAPVQDGVTKVDRVLEMVVPFYGTYTGIKRGDYLSAYLSFLAGVMVLVPTAIAAGKLAAVSKKSLMMGIQVAVGSLSRRGLVKGTMLGIKHAGTHLPSIGMHAMHTAGTLLDAFVPVPLGTRSFGELFVRSYKYLQPAMLRQAAASLRAKFPRLAARLRVRIAPSKASPMKFTLFRKSGARPVVAPDMPDIGNARPPFVKTLTAEGDTRWLRRFGNGYTLFDPQRLEPVGAIFVQGSDGALVPSLQVSEFARHALVDPGMLAVLRRAPVSADGTLSVEGKTFAPIAGSYVEIVPRAPKRAGEVIAWHTPRPDMSTGTSADMPTEAFTDTFTGAPGNTVDAAADTPTLLTYEPKQGGWISLAPQADDGATLMSVLDRWAIADHSASFSETDAITRIRENALKVYGNGYADFLQARGARLQNDLNAAQTPVETAVALLGDGRFLHAMLALDPAPAERIVLVLDRLRQYPMAGRGGLASISQLRSRIARYFQLALQDLDAGQLRHLREVLDAYGDRAIALMRHARTGNTAQRRRADEIAGMVDILRRSIAERLEPSRSGSGSGVQSTSTSTSTSGAASVSVPASGSEEGATAFAAGLAVPPPTTKESLVLQSLGLAPKPIPQATLDEISSRLQQADTEFESAVTAVNALTANQIQRPLDIARTAVLGALKESLRKLNPVNAEDVRLLYRALLEDRSMSVNGLAFAGLAGKYGIDADDMASQLFPQAGAPQPVSAAPLAGLDMAGVSAYRAARPANAIALPGDLPLFFEKSTGRFFIRQGGDWFQVRWDRDGDTWRLVQSDNPDNPDRPDRPDKPGMPVRRRSQGWEVQNRAGSSPGGSMLAADVLERYGIADATLRQALAQAQVSGDGTIMLGAKRYAGIEGAYLELVADHAASTPDMPVWRIAGAPLPGTRNGAARLAFDKKLGVWREPEIIPRVEGGGGRHSTPVRPDIGPRVSRIINEDVPNAMTDKIVMLPDDGSLVPMRLKNTETVKLAEQVLRQATDLTDYPWWKEEFDDYFDIVVLDLEKSAYAKVDPSLADPANDARIRTSIEDNMRTFLTEFYARSETFRGLANNARAKRILRKDRAWVIQIALPDTLKNGKATIAASPQVLGALIPGTRIAEVKKILVPDIQTPPYMSPSPYGEGTAISGVIVDGGKHVHVSAAATIIHEFTHFLALQDDPQDSFERGVIEYLTQRMLKEAGIKVPRRLVYAVPTNDGSIANLMTTEVDRFHRFADAQDEYLSTRFPLPEMPAKAWNPAAGNERWLTADTSAG